MEGLEADAQAYDELSKPQVESSSKFIDELRLSQGDKVLDMGCGTGILTKYIADIVGPDGQVVGVDPDAARIKIAKEKYKEISNLQFHVGSSVTGFPHDNEPYYDAHISTSAFHWVPDDEKIYIQKAHQCLKSGGTLAILSGEKTLNFEKNVFSSHPLTEDGYQKLFREVGLFAKVLSKKITCDARFKTLHRASTHQDWDKLDPKLWKYATKEKDGSIACEAPHVIIMAVKHKQS